MHVSTFVGFSRKCCGSFDLFGFVVVNSSIAFLGSVPMIFRDASEFFRNPRMLKGGHVMWSRVTHVITRGVTHVMTRVVTLVMIRVRFASVVFRQFVMSEGSCLSRF
jgi:hypothetical protein